MSEPFTTEEQETISETERQRQIKTVMRMELGELQEFIDRAAGGEMVVVPDGLVDVIRRLRSDLTMALGPQEAHDLVPVFRAFENRVAAVEFAVGEVIAVQRWTLAYWLARFAAFVARDWAAYRSGGP